MAGRVAGHAGVLGADRPCREPERGETRPRPEGRTQAILAQPPSPAGIHAEFWDVPAIREVVKILSDDRYQSGPSHQLLLRLCGLSFKLPDPFDEHRNEKAITRRMTEVKTQVKSLLDQGREVYAADEEAYSKPLSDPRLTRVFP